jgi:hypothetical protein
MFEKEIKFIGDFCFNQIRSLGNSFTLDKIIATGIHPAIVQYVSAELEYMIYSDRQKLLQQSYFDYTGKEISDHFQKISSEIKKQKKISIDDSKKLIFQAVSFNINYLVRPRWSLTKLIFNEQPVISAEEMKMMMNYLYYYEYFRKVLTGYINKRNLMQISATEFEIILDKIDNELINSNQRQVVSNSFVSIGDFFNIGGVDKNLLPLSAVEIFCKEKNLLDLLVKLRKVIPSDIKRRYDRNEIERILFISGTNIKEGKTAVLETEIKTDEVIEKIDADQIDNAPIEEVSETEHAEIDKSDLETFLSPEEEEALLSLYSEETKTSEVVLNDEINSIEEKIVIEEENEVIDLSQTNVDNEIIVETESTEGEPGFTEESSLIDNESEFNDSEKISEKIFNSDKELDEIVDAITDQIPEDNLHIEDTTQKEFEGSSVEEDDINNSEIDTELTDASVEKEIVQEMIEDLYSDKETEVPEIDEIEELETKSENIPDEIKSTNPENKIESLENELLHIFEDLDKMDFTLPQKGKPFEETTDEQSSFENDLEPDNVAETLVKQTDSFDDYLKDIDEILFTEESADKTEESVQIENNLEEAEQKIETKEESIPVREKIEKPVVKPRNVRPKDMFSYLRRKEIKKIVSFIFANDEEDFTNTVERVMDCHSYKEASEILKAVFTSYKISPYSKEAITFTNAVSNYFRQA